MIWGMPSLAEAPDMAANVALCRRLGLDFVELNMNLPEYQADALEAAAEVARRQGVGVTVHADENFDPANFNPLIARAHLETMRWTLRAARRAGVPVVNMHLNPGVHFTLPDGRMYLYDRYREFYLDRMRALRELCAREACGAVRICIENTDGYRDFQKQAVALLLECDAFALTWDVGHSHCCRDCAGEERFLLDHRDRLAHFHVHDADGRRNHMALGDGTIDLERRLAMARDLGARCVLEVKTVGALARSVAWLRSRNWIGSR